MENARTAGVGPNAPPRASPFSPTMVMSTRPVVLVAAATAELRDELSGLLGSLGCEVRPVADGREALRLLRGDGFRLALLDADLPNLSGLQVLEELRSHTELPVILTGPDDHEAKRRAVWLNADRYLVRPFNPSQLLRAVGSVLAHRPD